MGCKILPLLIDLQSSLMDPLGEKQAVILLWTRQVLREDTDLRVPSMASKLNLPEIMEVSMA